MRNEAEMTNNGNKNRQQRTIIHEIKQPNAYYNCMKVRQVFRKGNNTIYLKSSTAKVQAKYGGMYKEASYLIS